MLRLHSAGYAQHERTSKPARPERSEAKSKGEQGVFTTHLKKDPYMRWLHTLPFPEIGQKFNQKFPLIDPRFSCVSLRLSLSSSRRNSQGVLSGR